MEYIESGDGIKRTTVRPNIRLTRDEYLIYNRAAREIGFRSLTDWLSMHLFSSSIWREELVELCGLTDEGFYYVAEIENKTITASDK